MSEEMVPNIIGYHANHDDRCKIFVNDGKLIWSNDVDYLGGGMYFWDNVSNTHWWKVKKIKSAKKEGMTDVIISMVSANILLGDHVLDLTDKKQTKLVRKLWNEYCDKKRCKQRKKPMGVILDLLFTFFDEQFDAIKVLKGHGDYSTNPDWTMLEETRLDGRTRTIYSVKSPDVLKNRQFFVP
jgi:hypothetical protein